MKYLFLITEGDENGYMKAIALSTNLEKAKALAKKHCLNIEHYYSLAVLEHIFVYVYQIAINEIKDIYLVCKFGQGNRHTCVSTIENPDPVYAFCLGLLEDDPLAIDAVKDILKL